MRTPSLIIVMWALALLPTEAIVIYYNVFSRDSSLAWFVAIIATIQVVILLVGAAGGTVMMARDSIKNFRFRRRPKAIPVAMEDIAVAGDC